LVLVALPAWKPLREAGLFTRDRMCSDTLAVYNELLAEKKRA